MSTERPYFDPMSEATLNDDGAPVWFTTNELGEIVEQTVAPATAVSQTKKHNHAHGTLAKLSQFGIEALGDDECVQHPKPVKYDS